MSRPPGRAWGAFGLTRDLALSGRFGPLGRRSGELEGQGNDRGHGEYSGMPKCWTTSLDDQHNSNGLNFFQRRPPAKSSRALTSWGAIEPSLVISTPSVLSNSDPSRSSMDRDTHPCKDNASRSSPCRASSYSCSQSSPSLAAPSHGSSPQKASIKREFQVTLPL